MRREFAGATGDRLNAAGEKLPCTIRHYAKAALASFGHDKDFTHRHF
jgi:hypothetical protein